MLFHVFVLLFSSATYGGADNISHYQIARFSFKYPKLFLDLWGKPVYTILLAPFTLLGYQVAKAFNIIVFIVSLFLTAKIARKILQDSWIFIVILAAFSPVYYYLATTCLTEMLFSLFLVASVYLFFNSKYFWAALVISFIPFVRTEGMIFIPVFMVAFILRRQYKPIFVLATGTLFYSFIGCFVFKDLLWLIHQMPYSMGESFYGKGPIFHFIDHRNEIFGLPMVVLLVPGLIFWIYQIIREKIFNSEQLVWFILIAGCWVGYFIAHSYVWWKGTGGSLGLIRVIGGIIPLAALTAAKSFELLSEINRKKVLTYSVMAVFALAQIVWFFRNQDFILTIDPAQELIGKSADYIRHNEEGKKVFYFDPMLIHYLKLDPYDIKKCNWWIADRDQPSNSMEWGDLLVWDAHFGPNEGGVQLKNLMNDPYLQLKKALLPNESFKVLGGYDYGIYIFQKVEQKVIPEKKQMLIRTLVFSDSGKNQLTEINGIKLLKMDSGMEYSPGIQIPVSQIQMRDYMEISASVRFFPLEQLGNDDVLLVLSIDVDHKSVSYNRISLLSNSTDPQNVQETTLPLKISCNYEQEAMLHVYVWNKDKKNLLLDNLVLTINGF